MRLTRFLVLAVAALCFVPFAHADHSPVNLGFSGANGNNGGHSDAFDFNTAFGASNGHSGDSNFQNDFWDTQNPGSQSAGHGNAPNWFKQGDPFGNDGRDSGKSGRNHGTVHTPEPSSLALLLCGIFALAAFVLARSRATA